MSLCRGSSGILLAALLLSSAPAWAQRATYAAPAELEAEGPSHVLEVAVLGEYAHIDDQEQAGGVSDLGALALRNRLFVGRRAAYCLGLDGQLGASNEGLAYGLTGYVAGLGLRWGEAGRVALCGGAGFDGAAGGVPLAARFPAELSLALAAGPLRAIPWARVAWTAGASARRDGVSWLSAVDEVEAGLLVRFARQHRYWATVSGGGGLAFGLTYRELMGTSSIGVLVGLDLTGAQ